MVPKGNGQIIVLISLTSLLWINSLVNVGLVLVSLLFNGGLTDCLS